LHFYALVIIIAIMKSNPGYKNCQSCGMPLHRDEHGGGTNADGSVSTLYCSHCYQAGRFTLPDITPAQMQERVRLKLKEIGVPKIASWFFTRNIPRLARWRDSAS
jgi:hypothetical protein